MTKPRIKVQEVALRDGFQSEYDFVPTAQKIALCNALSRTGLSAIEVTAFVSPKAIPLLADAAQVMQGIDRVPGVRYGVLVPNLRGLERALDVGPDDVNLFMSVTEGHNRANVRASCEESFASLSQVIHRAWKESVSINVSLSCAFGCPIDGEVSQHLTLAWVERFMALGVTRISLADTTGMAYPRQVSALCEEAQRRWPQARFSLHFHNTRGMGLANVLAGAATGIRSFDASLGGIGGCPYAPGASGNICTEDTVHLLECEGFDTGVDLSALIACARQLPEIVGHGVPGQVVKAGARLAQTDAA